MDRYTKKYLESHCVDVFFRCGDKPIHILTFGNDIPEELNNIVTNRKLQQTVVRMHQYRVGDYLDNGSVIINDSYLQTINAQFTVYNQSHPEMESQMPELSDIVRMFAPNAGIGFYSYDFSKLENDKAEYVLVASPSQNTRIDQELMDRLPNLDGCDITENMKLIKI